MSMFSKSTRPEVAPGFSRSTPMLRPPSRRRAADDEPGVLALARNSAPDDNQRAIQEVVIAMASDAVRAGTEARAECDRLDDTLKLFQQHVFEVVADYAQRVAGDHRHRTAATRVQSVIRRPLS